MRNGAVPDRIGAASDHHHDWTTAMAGSIRKRQWQDRQGKLKNAWFVDYYDKAGHRQRQQFTTKRMAEERLRQIANELHAGVHTPDAASVTVTEAARQWLQQAQRNSLER